MSDQTTGTDAEVTEAGRRYFYEGEFYARPVERGVCLGPPGADVRDCLDDVVYDLLGDRYSRSGGSRGRIRLSVEILEAERR